MSELLAFFGVLAFLASVIFGYPLNFYFVLVASFLMLCATYLRVERMER